MFDLSNIIITTCPPPSINIVTALDYGFAWNRYVLNVEARACLVINGTEIHTLTFNGQAINSVGFIFPSNPNIRGEFYFGIADSSSLSSALEEGGEFSVTRQTYSLGSIVGSQGRMFTLVHTKNTGTGAVEVTNSNRANLCHQFISEFF